MGKSFLLDLETGKKSLTDRQLGTLAEELYSDLHCTVSAIAAEVCWILNNLVDMASLSDSAADYLKFQSIRTMCHQTFLCITTDILIITWLRLYIMP